MGSTKHLADELEAAGDLMRRAAKRIRELEAALAKREPSYEKPLGTRAKAAPKKKAAGKYHGLGRTPVNGTYDGHVPHGAAKVSSNPITWPSRTAKTKEKVPSKPEYPVTDMDRYIVLLARKAAKDRKEWQKLCRAISECRRLVLMQIAGIVAEATKRKEGQRKS